MIFITGMPLPSGPDLLGFCGSYILTCDNWDVSLRIFVLAFYVHLCLAFKFLGFKDHGVFQKNMRFWCMRYTMTIHGMLVLIRSGLVALSGSLKKMATDGKR